MGRGLRIGGLPVLFEVQFELCLGVLVGVKAKGGSWCIVENSVAGVKLFQWEGGRDLVSYLIEDAVVWVQFVAPALQYQCSHYHSADVAWKTHL